jgi:hypothetical protein
MPMDRGTPDLVRHCVAAVAKQYGGDTSKAFAICVASLQKAGYLKAGTMELTAAGKKKEAEHEAEPDAEKKMKAYEKLLKANRKEESFSYKQDAEWDASFYERLVRPEQQSGFEALPRTVAQRWDAIREEESDMTFMRRLAGITDRYTDRKIEEGTAKLEAKSKAKVGGKVFTLFIDGQEKFGFHASDEKDADSKAKGWLLYQFGSYNRVKWEVKQQEPEYMNNIHDEFMRAVGEASHLSLTDRLRALLSEGEDYEDGYHFYSEDGGMFVLQKLGNKFVVATAGATADDAMADLYSHSVRKAASMADAIKTIKKMVR